MFEMTLVATGSVWDREKREALTKDWQVVFHFGRTARGELTIARLEVLPSGKDVPEGGVTTALIRGITIAAARRYVVNKEQIQARQRAAAKPGRRGRPRLLTPRDYQKVMKRYDRLVERGDPHPSKTLFGELKREGVTQSWSTVRSWVARADPKRL
jgi:hypothetical protein